MVIQKRIFPFVAQIDNVDKSESNRKHDPVIEKLSCGKIFGKNHSTEVKVFEKCAFCIEICNVQDKFANKGAHAKVYECSQNAVPSVTQLLHYLI
jgi:hypothetical protein